jgi:hypothetical protein
MLEEVGASHHHAFAQREAGQHAPFERGEPQRQAVELEGADMRVEAERPASHHGIGIAGGAPDQRAQAHHEFLGTERLGEEVVGARLEPFDLVAPGVAGGEDQHRQPQPGGAPGAQHGDAADFRQAEVEHRGIVEAGRTQMLTVLAVGGMVDDEVLLTQAAGDLAGKGGVVLDEEDLHGKGSTGGAEAARPLTRER